MFHKYKTDNGSFFFVLKNEKNEIILISEPYVSDVSCEAWIAAVMNNADQEWQFEPFHTDANHHSFRLLSSNKKRIATGPVVSTSAARDALILDVQKNAPSASVSNDIINIASRDQLLQE